GTQDGDVVLTLTDTAGTDLNDSEVGVAVETGNNALTAGDRVTLLSNQSGLDTSGVTQTELTGYQGISLEYDFVLENDNGEDLADSGGNNNLYAVLADQSNTDPGPAPVRVQEQTKAPVEGRLAAMGMVLQGADIVGG